MNLSYPDFKLSESEASESDGPAAGDSIASTARREEPVATIRDLTPTAEERAQAARQAARTRRPLAVAPQPGSSIRVELQLPRVDVVEVLRRYVRKSGFKIKPSERSAIADVLERLAVANREIAENTPGVVAACFKAVAADLDATPHRTTEG